MKRIPTAAVSICLLCLLMTLCCSVAGAQFLVEGESNHSSIGFSISIAGGLSKVTGQFTESRVTISWVDSSWMQSDFTRASINAVVSTASVNTGNQGRDKDLQDSLFFHTSRFPEMTFKSKIIQKRDSGYVAVGDLTLRGVTKSIELPFRTTGYRPTDDGRPVWGFSAVTLLNRKDFGVGNDWVHSAIPGFLGDMVEVELFLWTRPPRKAK